MCNNPARLRGWCVPHEEAEADRLFSLWIRRRDGRCTAANGFNLECKGVLQAAHFIGRTNKTGRYDKRNVHALCQAHHLMIDQKGREGAKLSWVMNCIGTESVASLILEVNTTMTKRPDAIEAALEWLLKDAA
jgi:hypothetical protein